jgi:hypothetical protein
MRPKKRYLYDPEVLEECRRAFKRRLLGPSPTKSTIIKSQGKLIHIQTISFQFNRTNSFNLFTRILKKKQSAESSTTQKDVFERTKKNRQDLHKQQERQEQGTHHRTHRASTETGLTQKSTRHHRRI